MGVDSALFSWNLVNNMRSFIIESEKMPSPLEV